MNLFAGLPPPPDPFGLFPQYEKLKDAFLQSANGDNGDRLEETFLNLYCHLHGYEAPYTVAERQRVDETGGYWCHAGGISPILKAAPYIQPETVSGDFGAGNGLQGLLLQKLYPHQRCVQVEISHQMVEAGKHLQEWLGIDQDRVQWQVADVMESSGKGMNFVYLYRPVRPEGRGVQFYRNLSRDLESTPGPVVVFSIADCLRSYLSARFQVIYSDGHLTCYRG